MFRNTARRMFVLFFVLAIGSSLSFGRAPQGSALDAAQKKAIVEEISTFLNKNYVFLETAQKIGDALRNRLKNGDFDKWNDAPSFARAVAATIAEVGKDKHMDFFFDPETAANIRRLQGRNEDEAKKVRDLQLQQAQRDNFGFRRVEQLPGNIGYLDFRSFNKPDWAGETAIAAMNFLAYCDAIIVDLRQNGGGEPAQVQLISSYFFANPAHLNDLYSRASDYTENYWTLPFVPGPKPVDADLYILTSSFTFSGAEEFTYNMKNLKRATVIGETTGGGAHPTGPMIVQENFILSVPNARAINPVSKTNWEGVGVSPDIAVPAAQAFDRAYALAVEKLAAKTADPQRKAEYEWILVGMKAKTNSPRIDEKILKDYAGVYGERKVTFENGGLYYQRTGPKYRLIPLTETIFAAEGLDYFRVEFVAKDGKVVELIGLYNTGQKDPSPRTK